MNALRDMQEDTRQNARKAFPRELQFRRKRGSNNI